MRERFFDEKDREAIGWVKRCQEYKAMIPGFADRLKESPAEVLKEYGLPLKPEDVFFKKHPDNMDPKQHKRMEAEYPGSKAELYAGFMNKKLDALQTLRDDNTPSNSKFAKWRENQILRCILDLGPQAPFLVHVPISFEIADGCSVGCEFCGLNAGPLKELFRYTDENAALWKDVLARSKEVVGPAAGGGTLYCATEPLDNPDYELLMHDFKDCFGVIPQITTATAARHIDRLHELLKELNEDGRTVYRFSILSEEIFHKIMDAFTPEELVLVELIPQFDEARNHHFVHTGRYARDHKSMPAYQMEQEGLGQEEDAPEKAYSGTIACMSGFLINMCRRSITLSTPTWQDEDHPTGQYILAEEHFTDGAD
ncbi:MAG: radical SAM family RiPP maturation amino acid epimerase, partial [Lachnospiraceae bacterium]|nr:radical SAM family RiPP maturation amino acid epimerase [Lachnospiraceae bacterium]